MLPKPYRLSTIDASIVRRSGKRFTTPELLLQFLATTDTSSPRFFIQVPAKRIRTSVARHRLKRVLTESLRLYFLDCLVPGAYVITVSQPLPTITRAKMKELLENLCKKASLLL